ncbi:hypothetical protein Glove_229g102 [Diversispora epigaea]|uniref:Protein kinase domain-containing protein n=1 Tax=Diversispora epigaea TaxID=1348612 RepID=A0A397IIX8_9GLOM|nr:hypothetical protein Glove_229g102 [Diversispora epigaea]
MVPHCSNGQHNLGHCYGNGIGTTKDEKKAFQWYVKSAEGGNIIGQNTLGECYYYGNGTTKDEEKAFQWYLKSAEGGDSNGQHNLGHCYINGIGTSKDEEKAFQWYLKSAESGNSDGQYNLGNCYLDEIGTTKDEEKAFQWYLKSAEGGNIIGQNTLGECYYYGNGTTKDEEKAFQWYLKSAESGNSDGQYNLGNCYLDEIGTTKDEEKAFQWFLKSADGGNNVGQNILGYCFHYGIGTTKDEEEAFQWYLKSAKEGNSDGQNNIGRCYENGIGIAKDEEKAFQWYLKAAEKGNSKAQNNLGFYYENGIGTIENKEKAFQWYLKSAKGGNSDGQNNIGYCYKNGIGITKDEEKAFQWYLKAVEKGNIKAQNNLGFCYENGIGTIENKEKAFHWYKISAEGGNNDGQYNLGCCYLFGEGTTKDEKKAFQWYLKAAEGGNKFGQNSLEYCYRNEIEISKLMQNITAKGTKSTLIDNLTSLHNNYCCCICWQTSSCNKICKKYFQDFGICYNCGDLNISKNICPNCKLTEVSYLSKWSSGNYEIDKIIQTTQLDENANEWEIWRWIDYSKFKNIKYLDEGGFSSVWKAEWINIPMGLFKFYNSNKVALKKLKNSQKISSEFLKELSANFKCRDNKNICPNCKLTEVSYLSKWSSGNYEIDKIIQTTQLDENANEWEIWRWIDYSKFKNIKYLDEGGFSSVWKAEWINIPMGLFKFYNSNKVALKKLKNSQKISSEFLKELSANFKCRDKYVLPILGITQDPITEEYAIVLRYMENGNLRDFFEQNKIIPWIERLWLLESFIRGLKVIHDKGFIHRDIHPGNLMITEKYNNNSKLKFIRLGDLGLCRLVNEISSSDVYGVLPYVAPEVLNKHQYTQASDIYSVGIIMWVISTGKIPFSYRAYDLELTLKILKGLRPEIEKGTPQCYAELMKKCWHKDPSERPSVEEIFDISEKWIYELMYDDKTECSIMFLNAEQEMKNVDSKLLNNEANHPEISLTNDADDDEKRLANIKGMEHSIMTMKRLECGNDLNEEHTKKKEKASNEEIFEIESLVNNCDSFLWAIIGQKKHSLISANFYNFKEKLSRIGQFTSLQELYIENCYGLNKSDCLLLDPSFTQLSSFHCLITIFNNNELRRFSFNCGEGFDADELLRQIVENIPESFKLEWFIKINRYLVLTV